MRATTRVPRLLGDTRSQGLLHKGGDRILGECPKGGRRNERETISPLRKARTALALVQPPADGFRGVQALWERNRLALCGLRAAGDRGGSQEGGSPMRVMLYSIHCPCCEVLRKK